MRMQSMILWVMLFISLSATAQSAKTKSTTKKKTTTVRTTKPKATTTKTSVLENIPADAYVFKDKNRQDGVINAQTKTIVIEGSDNHIEIGEGNEKIYIKGSSNDIIMKSTDNIIITGDNNFVSWESSKNASGKPVVIDKGGYNNVGKKSGEALKKTDN